MRPGFRLGLSIGKYQVATPGRLFTSRNDASVLLRHLPVFCPEHLAKVHMAGQHDGLATFTRPVERGLEAVRKAAIQGDGVLQGAGGNAHGTDGPIGVNALSILNIDWVVVGIFLPFHRERPIFSLIAKSVVAPSCFNDIYALLEQLAIHLILGHLTVPWAGGLDPWHCYVVLKPACLIAAHEGNVEAPA